jgi:phosphatidylinositol alpha 1,6-mannosyltransferase
VNRARSPIIPSASSFADTKPAVHRRSNHPTYREIVKMRVAVVTESFLPSTNGVTNSVIKILESLKAEGHEAIIIAPTSPFTEYLGFPVIRTTNILFRTFPVALPLINMTSILRSFRPDVVHVASPFLLGRQALAVSRRLSIPCVAVYQTDIAGYTSRYGLGLLGAVGRQLVRNIHRLADVTLAPTHETARYLRDMGVTRVAVWGRGVDTKQYYPQRRTSAPVHVLRDRIAPNHELVIGFVGRIAPEKQVGRFRELFGLKNAVFLIVGDGPERAALQEEFADHPVTFTGALHGDDLANAYAAMDVFVHCGEEETFGQTIQEALASGVPVVAPAAGGPLALITSGENGFLVDPREPEAYRKAVKKILKHADVRHDMRIAARASVSGKSWAANNAKLFKHYAGLIGVEYELTHS